jgi:hypothetical protein
MEILFGNFEEQMGHERHEGRFFVTKNLEGTQTPRLQFARGQTKKSVDI